PSDASGFAGLAQVARAEGRSEEALDHWDVATRLAPLVCAHQAERIRLLIRLSRHREALTGLADLRRRFPNDRLVWRIQLELAQARQDRNLADEAAEAVLSQEPDFSLALVLKG